MLHMMMKYKFCSISWCKSFYAIIMSVTRQKGISAAIPFLKFFALKTLLTKVYHHTKYDKDLMKFKEISEGHNFSYAL